ncbi:MAG: hypothetical protein PPHEINF_1703 [uncultured Paraburkholderia sp.]|nr:MAG: hypothetical protein PPHEINF_1703 [uncultured Paraburkholderia sp.]CAH2783594.1 MAG: hypothetical protein PPHEESC_1743 [uncultured Paraburkholderia sp.]CAH2918644.1 MAG: hypothetical protein PPHEMADMSA_1859 [uncultured Paraburkholderia sp.]
MKTRLIVAYATGLFVTSGLAYSQGMPETSQPVQQENAATQNAAPDTTSRSYGGMPRTQMQSGMRRAERCTAGPQCNIFFGGS